MMTKIIFLTGCIIVSNLAANEWTDVNVKLETSVELKVIDYEEPVRFGIENMTLDEPDSFPWLATYKISFFPLYYPEMTEAEYLAKHSFQYEDHKLVEKSNLERKDAYTQLKKLFVDGVPESFPSAQYLIRETYVRYEGREFVYLFFQTVMEDKEIESFSREIAFGENQTIWPVCLESVANEWVFSNGISSVSDNFQWINLQRLVDIAYENKGITISKSQTDGK